MEHEAILIDIQEPLECFKIDAIHSKYDYGTLSHSTFVIDYKYFGWYLSILEQGTENPETIVNAKLDELR